MVSMVRTTGDGATVEVGPVGRDGMVGVPVFLDTLTDPLHAFAQILPDRDTAVVVLTHDDKFDIPALAIALRSEAFYVGALGSRIAQAKRRERLLEAGVTEQQLERLRGPAGLDIGAESPAETAVSIMGEALALRAGRLGGPLREAAGRIHVER